MSFNLTRWHLMTCHDVVNLIQRGKRETIKSVPLHFKSKVWINNYVLYISQWKSSNCHNTNCISFLIFFFISFNNRCVLIFLLGAVPTWYCERYEGSNMTYTANQTTEQCKMNGKTCAKYKYDESFTSIVSEVHF